MKSSHLLAFAALFGLSGSLSAAWTRLPDTAARPVNLAAKAIPGTKIVASKGVENANNLLSADPAAASHIAAGKSEFTIKLVNQQVVDNVSFVNDGMEGKVTCASSPDEKNWTTLGHAVFSAGDRVVPVTFASAQGKYISISFESAQGGTIRGLRIYGAATSKDFVLKPSPSSSGNVNLAGGGGGAHAIYAFPSPSNAGELDFRNNVFRFPNTGDKYRIIVYDLGSPRTIREFSTAYSQRPVRLEVFAFQDLPEKKDWRGKLTLDPSIFEQSHPVAVGEDARGVGHIRVVPNQAVTAQFVALRFEPNYLHTATTSAGFWGEFADLGFGSAAPILNAFNLLPQAQLTAGDSGFTVGDVNIGTTGLSCVPGNGTGNEGNGGTNQPSNTGQPVDGAPPYLPGTPGSPPAGTGGLPAGGGGTGTTTNNNNPGNVNVTVSGAGGSGGGTNAGNGGTNNPGTNGP